MLPELKIVGCQKTSGFFDYYTWALWYSVIRPTQFFIPKHLKKMPDIFKRMNILSYFLPCLFSLLSILWKDLIFTFHRVRESFIRRQILYIYVIYLYVLLL